MEKYLLPTSLRNYGNSLNGSASNTDRMSKTELAQPKEQAMWFERIHTSLIQPPNTRRKGNSGGSQQSSNNPGGNPVPCSASIIGAMLSDHWYAAMAV